MYNGGEGGRERFVVIIILGMMSELKKDVPLLSEEDSTQTFILQKYYEAAVGRGASRGAQIAVETSQQSQKDRAKVIFNGDGKFYTPAFIDPCDQDVLAATDDRLKEVFQEKVEETHPRKEMLLPKPSSHYCFVCREHFTDYFKHIVHPVHQKNIAASGPQQMIEDLIEEFGRKHRRAPTMGFIEAGEGPRKRVKLDESQGSRSKEEALFKDASTCLPRASISQPLFHKN